jgi:sterol O-acyltransferase
MERHPPLAAAPEDVYRLVGQLASDGSIGSLKPDLREGSGIASSGTILSGDSRSSSTTEFSDTTSDEDYDTLKVNPSAAVMGRKGGGFLARENQTWSEKQFEKHYEGVKRGSVDRTNEAGAERRQSFSVKLEKTDEIGRYLLTSDDPELRELLAIITERTSSDGKKRRAKFSDLIFTRQFTAFDRHNPASAASPFHGFFTLFWLGVFMFILKLAGENWRAYGSAFGRTEIIHIMFSREVAVLGMTDGIMCAGTIMGLLLQIAIARGWIRWNRAGWVIQNVSGFCYKISPDKIWCLLILCAC